MSRSNAPADGSGAPATDTLRRDVRFCAWTWDASERRWLSGCGYAFEERRHDHADTTGEWHPFPFCPYCGALIRKPNTRIADTGGANAIKANKALEATANAAPHCQRWPFRLTGQEGAR